MNLRRVSFLLLIIALITAEQVCGQYQYFHRRFNFNDAAHASFHFRDGGFPSALLVSGYLKGKLKGFAFEFSEQVKTKPPRPDQIPQAWNSKTYYVAGDVVSFKGDGYAAMMDEPSSRTPDENSDAWARFEIVGDPYSTVFSWPTLADTLSREQFKKRVSFRQNVFFEPWYEELEYHTNEIVEYDGSNFRLLKEFAKGVPPGKNAGEWEPVETITMASEFGPENFFGLDLLVLRNASGEEIPQMITALILDPNRDIILNAVSFDYAEATQYLRSISLPFAYQSPTGFLGSPNLILDDSAKARVLDVVKNGIRSGKIKTSPKWVDNAPLYELWMNGPVDESSWSVFQHPGTGALQVVQWTFAERKMQVDRVASFPWKNILPLIKGEPFHIISYREIFNDKHVHSFLDSVHADSLTPRYQSVIDQSRVLPSSKIFQEDFTVKVDPKNETQIPNWKEVWMAFRTCALNRKVIPQMFQSDIEWPIENTATVSDAEVHDFNPSAEVSQLTVTYKRTIDPSTSTCSPVMVTVAFADPLLPVNSYTVAWYDLKRELDSKSAGKAFIKAVEKASLPFIWGALQSTLREDR